MDNHLTGIRFSSNHSQEELNELEPMIDIAQNSSSFLQNHQSQPIMSNDMNVQQPKHKGGHSQQFGKKQSQGK